MKFLFIFLSLFVSTLLFSQAPEGINYQAVMRNSSSNLVTNTTVAIRVQIRQGSATGTAVYQERHSVLTSSQGLINLVIGAGTPQTGTFNAINWAEGPFFVNLAVDFSNGVNYQDFGTQQLMSVPYALYAKKSGVQLNQWRYGNTVPVNSLGVLGDFYLDVVTGNVYYKNSATTWVLTGNIKGAVGPSGAFGAQGVQGIQGATGAQGNQGIQGAAGTNGTNGTNGQNTLVKTTTETAGANCTTGGVKIEYGLDANSNGTLDVSEINATLTRYVCNGATGATGATGAQGIQGLTGAQGIQGVAGTNGTNGADGKNTLAKTTTEAAGANCTTGGVKIEYGLDANNNGTLDVSEINATLTRFVCNGATGAQGVQGLTGAQGIQGVAGSTGAAGAAGKNSLAKTTTEVAGVNCTTGGVKIEYGLDANSNGTLDVSEVNASLTKYVCNGAVGATGAQGIQGLTGAQGIQGVAGSTGVAGAAGKNTLVKTTTEAAGANCTTGGVKIEYGLDANSNGTLDVSEINATLTRYVCNGATGAQGIQGAAGTNGAQGIQGVAGTNGTNGTDGKNTLAKTTTEAAGTNCTTGGVKIEYGLDANSNGTLDVSEINATLTRYVCNGATGAQGIQGVAGVPGTNGTNGAQGIQGVAGTNGTNGTEGKNTLAKTTTEAAGANCTTGGVKIEYGLDANNNGTLDISEINAAFTKYVCNGAVGATGAQGIQGLTGAQGIQGVAGTNGTNGAQGIQGIAGTNGTNGKNTLAKTTTEAAGANCTTGGVKIEYGLDANSNGTLDVSEVNASLTRYVCNGATGAQGIQGVAGVPGTNGTNGAQGIQGVAGTNGTNGADGKNTLAKTTTEAAGANCTTGGVKIEYGLDANNNGTLDVSEINATLTRFVCNGATGAQGIQGVAGVPGTNGTNGAQGIQGVAGTNGTNGTDGKNTLAKTTTEAAGANCTTGGVKIEYGLDANSNGTLDVSEVNATLTRYVCNGATGAQGIQGLTGVTGSNGTNGLNALIKTTSEPSGTNCTNGGTKIETGLDANGNGVLDAGEVNASQTQYVCNGTSSTSSSNQGVRIGFSSSTTWTCPAGVTQITIELWGGGGGGGGGSFATSATGATNGCLVGCNYIGGKGGNGGLGGYNKSLITVVSGQTYIITVGLGGSKGLGQTNNSGFPGPSATNGGNGGNTSFDSFLTASGGIGGGRGISSSSSCVHGANGANGSVNNFQNNSYPIQSNTSARNYIPVGYVTSFVSATCCSASGSGGSGGNSSALNGNCMYGYQNGFDGTAGENGYCVISY